MQKLENLEKRLAFLEQTLLPAPILQENSAPLLEKLDNISIFLQKSSFSWASFKEKGTFSAFPLKNLEKALVFKEISQKLEENPTFFLGNCEKAKLMWFSANLIENIQENFKDLRKLSNFLDFDPFLELREKNLQIEPIIRGSVRTSERFQEISAEMHDFLANYQEIVDSFNKKLVFFDAVLASFEKNPRKTGEKP